MLCEYGVDAVQCDLQKEVDRLTKELKFARQEYTRLLTKMNNRWGEAIKQEKSYANANSEQGRE